MGVLERILAAKRAEIAQLLRRPLPSAPERRPLALRREPGAPLALIAEIKRRSPSAGPLSTRLSVRDRAAAYERGGAAMISVLCDAEFFDGGFEHLVEARQGCALPLLCKDFVLDEVQLDHARAHGADAVLLIVRCLGATPLRRLVRAARARELVPFVEVATEEEARVALDAEAELIGVNARDLDTLVMDAERARRVLNQLPRSVTRVHLSGLARPADVGAVAATGADAALIGEALMREDNPEPLLRALVSATRLAASAPETSA